MALIYTASFAEATRDQVGPLGPVSTLGPNPLFGADTGVFFEARNTSLENAEHLLHGIVLTLVFGLRGVEAAVHFRLQGVGPLVHGVQASVDLVEHGHHRHEQA